MNVACPNVPGKPLVGHFVCMVETGGVGECKIAISLIGLCNKIITIIITNAPPMNLKNRHNLQVMKGLQYIKIVPTFS